MFDRALNNKTNKQVYFIRDKKSTPTKLLNALVKST